jgi:hypothetical protein
MGDGHTAQDERTPSHKPVYVVSDAGTHGEKADGCSLLGAWKNPQEIATSWSIS